MTRWVATITLAATLGAAAVSAPHAFAQPAQSDDTAKVPVRSVEFIGMQPPSSPEQKASIYTAAKAKVTYVNGRSETLDLAYHQLMATGEKVNGKVVGGLIDAAGKPLLDDKGQIASDAPDGQSLMQVPGLKAASSRSSNPLALVTHYEYRSLPPAGAAFTAKDYWSKLPATMSLARVDQNKSTGALSVTNYSTINFASIAGLWIPCAGSLSPWGTHLGSEEYEPDAKVRGGAPAASDTGDTTDIASFSRFYFGDEKRANPYHYGIVPEVRVQRDGSTKVEAHYAMGRIARELVDVQDDGRTAYMGDDGGFTGLFMFVADRKNDLSAGTLYAGKWTQTSPVGTDGGSAKLSWVKLGHGSDSEIKKLVAGGITFRDIFEASNTDPGTPGFTKVHTYVGTEWLKLKPGMAQAAAFLETRRYAALLGATTEFNKMEGVTHDAAGRKAYVVISRVEAGMSDRVGDIQLTANKGGAIYELALTDKVKDSAGAPINSSWVATTMTSVPALLGSYSSTADASGNTCAQDRVCGGDNLKFSAGMRTLFIGEDTSYRNNNYVWAYNVQTKALARILSVPMGAEATGLQAVDNYNGSAYLMSNFQHPGEFGSSDPQWAQIRALLDTKWNKGLKASVGYIGTTKGALPAVR